MKLEPRRRGSVRKLRRLGVSQCQHRRRSKKNGRSSPQTAGINHNFYVQQFTINTLELAVIDEKHNDVRSTNRGLQIDGAHARKPREAFRQPANMWFDDKQLTDIAETKMPDLNANDIEAAKKQVAGTARSMGIRVG